MTRTSGHRRYRRMLACAALTLASLTVVTSAPARARPTILLPGSARLSGVFCTASTNCWAVGVKVAKDHAVLNHVIRWNGEKWTAVPVPSPGGTKTPSNFSQLIAVRCASARDCWAVGSYDGTTSQLAQALHWTGRKWVTVTIPEPGGLKAGQFTELADVACTSASDCWAVGDYGARAIGSVITHNFALRWTGQKWFKVKVPDPAGSSANDVNSLAAVRCSSAVDCWAGGTAGDESGPGIQENEMLHFNGTKWTEHDVPNPANLLPGSFNEINSLSCTSSKNCWAVGSYGGGSGSGTVFLNQALRWNGHDWLQVKTPNPNGTGSGDSNVLNGVTCAAANDCWAVGTLGSVSSGAAVTGEALRWSGTKWSLAKTPSPGGTAPGNQAELNAARCVSPKDCWAVGFSRTGSDPDRNVTLHWNSVKWSAS